MTLSTLHSASSQNFMFISSVCFYSHKLTYECLIIEKKICKIQHISQLYGLSMLSYDSVRSDNSFDH